ncbi:hypothetical protein BsWGS_25144 [Bradybaena similaris]
MNIAVGVSLLLSLVTAYDEKLYVIGPDRIQEFHACVGTSAYFPWPVNVIARTGHRSTVINLIFQQRHSEKKTLVASLTGVQLKADIHFRDRISVSSENSGVFLDRVTMDDAGTYFAQAHFSNGQVWTRATNLTVHLRPIVYNGRLNVSQSEVTYHPSKNIHCINITCGTLEYAGYPPAKFVWTGEEAKTLSTKTATDDSASSLQICSPYVGIVTCSIAGFSSVCTYDHVSTVHLDLPGPPINATVPVKSTSTQDLVLTIVMPILAVLVPLSVLGIWVLSHILRSNSQYREQQHFNHTEPHAEMDIGEPMPSDHNDEESDGEPTQIEVKFQVYDTDDDLHLHNCLEPNHTDYHPDLTDEFADEPLSVAQDESTSQENYGNRTNEERPLMDEVIGTVV